MTIVDDLLASPGLYIGVDQLAGSDHTGVARIVVTPLPGRSGVTLDYDVVNVLTPESARSHVEHTMIARTHGGGAVMVIGHPHAARMIFTVSHSNARRPATVGSKSR